MKRWNNNVNEDYDDNDDTEEREKSKVELGKKVKGRKERKYRGKSEGNVMSA